MEDDYYVDSYLGRATPLDRSSMYLRSGGALIGALLIGIGGDSSARDTLYKAIGLTVGYLIGRAADSLVSTIRWVYHQENFDPLDCESYREIEAQHVENVETVVLEQELTSVTLEN